MSLGTHDLMIAYYYRALIGRVVLAGFPRSLQISMWIALFTLRRVCAQHFELIINY